jgi:hypothetical protein
MRCLFLTIIFYSTTFPLYSQTTENIIDELKSINKSVTEIPCTAGNTPVISNRGMNVFLADKTGYLSESTDLSFYTNYVTFNSADGKFTVNHNFQKTTGVHEPLKKLFSVGAYANIANSLGADFLDKKFENELGVMVSYKWIGKVKTRLASCAATSKEGNQQNDMDALRASILHSLEMEMDKKIIDFKIAIGAIESKEIPGQDADSAKALMLRNFYEDLNDEYSEKFARAEAAALTKTNNFKLITTGWTNLSVDVPLVFPKFIIADSVNADFQEKHPYPLEVSLSHTRLWESSKAGRFFISLYGNIILNNSKLSHALDKTDFTTYQNLGGTDPLYLAGLKNDKAYIGNYETFVTPSLKGRFVYFPPDSHIGVSVIAEQSFGKYSLLNARVGIPVVLINSKKLPAANFEFYVLFFDMSNKIASEKKYDNNMSVGLHIGIPFSRLMY